MTEGTGSTENGGTGSPEEEGGRPLPEGAGPSVAEGEPAGVGEGEPSGLPEEPGFPTEILPAPEPVPRRRPGAYVAVAVGLAAMAGAAVFAAQSLRGGAGAESPEGAVQGFFDAVAQEDVLGVLETLLPSERDLVRGPLVEIAGQLARLGVLEKDIDLSKITGADLSFEGLKFSTSGVGDGVVAVRVEQGLSRYRIRPRELPLGRFVRDLAGDALDEPQSGSDQLSDEDLMLVSVRDGGRWYVSFYYTAVEGARRDSGWPAPAIGRGLRPKGTLSPEAAVDELLHAAARLDVRRLLELLPPDEARALHDYAPLFLPEAEAGAAEARKEFRAEITSLDLSARRDGDEARVKIDSITFRAEATDGSFSMSYDGECLSLEGEAFVPFLPADTICEGDQPPPGFGFPQLPKRDVDLAFVVVERGGLWYVSSDQTMLDGFVAVLKAMKPSDLDAFKGFFLGVEGEEEFSYSEVAPLTAETPST